jgi:hypothetical protein
MLTIEQLQASLDTGNVPRFPTHWVMKPDWVDQHQYRATMYYIFLGGKEIVAQLTHDNDESQTGDIASPAKKHIQGLEYFKTLCVPFEDAQEKKLAKCCDKLDVVLKLKQQFDAVGRLPERLMTIYETEREICLDLAKELGKSKEVKKLLKELV